MAGLARSGAAPSVGQAVAPSASVQLTADGLSFKRATRRVDVMWSELREIGIRTSGDSFAGLFVMIGERWEHGGAVFGGSITGGIGTNAAACRLPERGSDRSNGKRE